MNDETSTRRRAPVPLPVPPGGPWTLRTREPGSGGRRQVTAACTRCGAVPWDEPLGMTVTFAGIEAARQELPGLGWPSAPRAAEPSRCSAPSALPGSCPDRKPRGKKRTKEGRS